MSKHNNRPTLALPTKPDPKVTFEVIEEEAATTLTPTKVDPHAHLPPKVQAEMEAGRRASTRHQ